MTKQDPGFELTYSGEFPEVSSARLLIQQASDIAVNLDRSGRVAGIYVSPECPAMGCLDHWIGRDFKTFLSIESKAKFEQRVTEIRELPSRATAPMELNHVDNAAWEFPIRYTALPLEDSDGLLLIGRDLQPIGEVQQRLVNEQLSRERDRQLIRKADTFYRVALEASETPLAMIDPETGRIRDINLAAATLLGAKPETLPGNAFNQVFERIRRGELMEALQSVRGSDGIRYIEAVARRNGRPVKIYPDFFRASGELAMLCRLEGAETEDTGGAQVGQYMSALFASSSDAIVIVDPKGKIREANEAFLILGDAAQMRDVVDRSFGNFLVRGEVDMRMLIDSTMREGHLRSYSTQFKSRVGTRASVDISASYLRAGSGELGIGLIIRDVGQSSTPGDAIPESVVSEQAVQNMMDLVGTASLKELVSATSDVIERMCIETALKMTGNNRVAAAEMLGLSRQSLYVKLRKFDMLNADDNS